jgi:hypothetical protein
MAGCFAESGIYDNLIRMIQQKRFPRLYRAFVCLFFCVPLFATCQSTSLEALADGLKGKIVFIRGMYIENNLKFDSQGKPIGAATPGPFFISTVKIEKSHLKGTTLELSGHRGVLVFSGPDIQGQTPQFVPFETEVHIRIDGTPDRVEDLQTLVSNILATDLKDALADKTSEERQKALNSLPILALASPPVLHAEAVSALPAQAKPLSANGQGSNKMPGISPLPGSSTINKWEKEGISPPRVIYSVPPLDPASHGNPPLGICIVQLIVDVTGFPEHIRIARSAGHDRDAAAIASVSQYRFAPATHNNEPVSVEVNIELVFHGTPQFRP